MRPLKAMCAFPARRATFGGVAVFGLAALAFGLSTHYAFSLAALAVMGAADMISVFVRSTVVQLGTPDDMRGRVSAVHMLFICTLAVVALWTRLFPALRRVDRLSDVSPPRFPARG
jgi:hypothetical protein